MVKRTLVKGLALFIVLTFVMSLIPSVCFAEAESNVVFGIWQDKLLSDVEVGSDVKATFANGVTQEGGIKFFRTSGTDESKAYTAKDPLYVAAGLHGDYKTDKTRTYYVDFGSDISGKVMANGYDKTFVSFYFFAMNYDKIDLSGFKIGAYKKDDGEKVLYTAVPLNKYVRIMQDKWILLEFSMKDLGLDGINNTAFEGLYFDTKVKDDTTDFYGVVGKFDKLNIVNTVGSGAMDFSGTYKVAPDLTFLKSGASAMESAYCKTNAEHTTTKAEKLTIANDAGIGVKISTTGDGASNTAGKYIKIYPIVDSSGKVTPIKSYYDTDNTDFVLKIKKGAKYAQLIDENSDISIGVGQIVNTTGSGWSSSPLKLGLVSVDKSKLSTDYIQLRIPLNDFRNATAVYEQNNTESAVGNLTIDSINVFAIVINTDKKISNANVLYIDDVGLAPHTEKVENKMVYGDNCQKWAMPDGAKEPLCYTLTSSGTAPEKLYDSTNTERTNYGTTNKIIFVWAYWGNDIYTPAYTKIGISFNAPKLEPNSDSKIRFSMNNYTTSLVNPALVIAYYNGEELADVQIVTDKMFAFGGYDSNTIEMSTDKTYTSYKAFMLDSIDNIIPLAESFDSTSATTQG